MPKQVLTGTLDEQVEFLYQLATEKMAEGNYTGAVHHLNDVIKYNPNYRDAQQLLRAVKRKKSQQTSLLVAGFVGAALFIGIGTSLRITNDGIFLALALTGAIVGYVSGLAFFAQKKST